MTDGELDRSAVRRGFERAARRYDRAAIVQGEVQLRLFERLGLTTLAPARILDLGTGTGRAIKPLAKYAPGAELLAVDIAWNMLARGRARRPWFRRVHQVCADAQRLPFASECVDLVFSNLTLQWCLDTEQVFREVRRILRERSLFLFSTFGPDTLKELREAWAEVDDAHHVHEFEDMHLIGDALVRAGFAEPVMDAEHLTVTYKAARDLMGDLKAIGASNVLADRRRTLTGRGRLAAFESAYERFREGGRLPATYEVVYGTAWTPVRLARR